MQNTVVAEQSTEGFTLTPEALKRLRELSPELDRAIRERVGKDLDQFQALVAEHLGWVLVRCGVQAAGVGLTTRLPIHHAGEHHWLGGASRSSSLGYSGGGVAMRWRRR